MSKASWSVDADRLMWLARNSFTGEETKAARCAFLKMLPGKFPSEAPRFKAHHHFSSSGVQNVVLNVGFDKNPFSTPHGMRWGVNLQKLINMKSCFEVGRNTSLN